jgi:hypothetical protein
VSVCLLQARESWYGCQDDYKAYIAHLQAAGFADVTTAVRDFPVDMTVGQWKREFAERIRVCVCVCVCVCVYV